MVDECVHVVDMGTEVNGHAFFLPVASGCLCASPGVLPAPPLHAHACTFLCLNLPHGVCEGFLVFWLPMNDESFRGMLQLDGELWKAYVGHRDALAVTQRPHLSRSSNQLCVRDSQTLHPERVSEFPWHLQAKRHT